MSAVPSARGGFSSGATWAEDVHLDDDESLVDELPGRSSVSPAQRSPGVRRGGRLGSPSGSSGQRSLWGWAEASLAQGARLDDDAISVHEDAHEEASSDEERGERVPLSVLLRSLNNR